MLLILKEVVLGPSFAHTVGMRTLGLLLTLVVMAPQAFPAQRTAVPEGATITSVDVSGVGRGQLSPGLLDAIQSLAGTPLQQAALDELATRIEAERPRHVAAGRVFMDPGGAVRVVFVVGRARERDQDTNVNTRYTVEGAEIAGVPDGELPDAVRADLQALADLRLDSEEAGQIERRIRQALPEYDISRRIVRGSAQGRIRLVYEARRRDAWRWLRFTPAMSNVVFHSDQGWGSLIELGIGGRDIRFTPIIAIDNGDDLIEEYSGFGLRFETRKLGTERLGASLEWTGFDSSWQDRTLDALALTPRIPAPYDERSTITPLVKFAVTPQLTLSAGVSISELEALSPATASVAANAAVASIGFATRTTDSAGGRHDVDASFGVRAGSRSLESDLVFSRYLGQGWYRYRWGHQRVGLTGMAGGITGHAPLFERFSLGDSVALRGWDKYEIAPAGGDRVAYSSIEYGFRGMSVFLDVGSVWDDGTKPEVRVSTGLGFHAGPAFLTIGFPLNTDQVRAVVALGLRLSVNATPGPGGRRRVQR
jgi:hypothetical protein